MSLIGSISGMFTRPTDLTNTVQSALNTAQAGGSDLLPSIDGKSLNGAGGANSLGSLAGAQGISSLPAASSATGAPSFGNMLQNFVSDVDGTMKTSQAEQGKVLSGQSTNLHQAMIAMQEASTSFSLMVEVRNKLVESYQELMRMQI
ncbi:MAG: flagellar hook-basal body complex protein FliE [Chthoniobacteraceae bacterium]